MMLKVGSTHGDHNSDPYIYIYIYMNEGRKLMSWLKHRVPGNQVQFDTYCLYENIPGGVRDEESCQVGRPLHPISPCSVGRRENFWLKISRSSQAGVKESRRRTALPSHEKKSLNKMNSSHN